MLEIKESFYKKIILFIIILITTMLMIHFTFSDKNWVIKIINIFFELITILLGYSLRKQKTLITLKDNGILYKKTLIEWRKIDLVTLGKISKNDFVFIFLKDFNEVLSNEKTSNSLKKMIKHNTKWGFPPINIPLSLAKGKSSYIFEQIVEYYNNSLRY